MAIDGQVCLHRWPFAIPVRPPRWTTESLGPVNGINKDVSGTRLLLTTVSTYPVDWICFCHLLTTQHCYLCSNRRYNSPSATHLPQTDLIICTIVHIPAKSLYTANAPSKFSVDMTSCSDFHFQKETDAYVNLTIDNLSATDTHVWKLFNLKKMKTQYVRSLTHSLWTVSHVCIPLIFLAYSYTT